MVAELQLTIAPKLSEGRLELRYVVNNTSDRDVYLVNRVHDASLQPSPDLVYIELLQTERAIKLYKDVPVIPPHRMPPMPHCPYPTPLRARQSFSEVVRVPLPVQEFRAYVAQPKDVALAEYEELQFSLGYYWSVPGMQELKRTLPSGTEVILPRPPPRTKLESGVLHARAGLQIPVLEPVVQTP